VFRRRGLHAALLLASLASLIAGCALAGGTLGGREKCWPAEPPRAASLWRGILVIDEFGASLETAEGDSIPLAAGALTPRINAAGVGELVAGERPEATAGQDVSLFGGAGADGYLVVCAVEEIHVPGDNPFNE
jgi:hypothetical protein